MFAVIHSLCMSRSVFGSLYFKTKFFSAVKAQLRDALVTLERRYTFICLDGVVETSEFEDDDRGLYPIQINTRHILDGTIILLCQPTEETNDVQFELIKRWITGELLASLRSQGYAIETARGYRYTSIRFDT